MLPRLYSSTKPLLTTGSKNVGTAAMKNSQSISTAPQFGNGVVDVGTLETVTHFAKTIYMIVGNVTYYKSK